jgi:hypothetical protein
MFVSSRTDSIFVTLTGFIDNAISFNFQSWSGMALPSKDIVPYHIPDAATVAPQKFNKMTAIK